MSALVETPRESRREPSGLLGADALQDAIFNSPNFSSIATDASGVIRIFNVGAERMLGYGASEVVNRMTPADLHDPGELVARAEALSEEFLTEIPPGFEALVFRASRGLQDIYELTKVRKDGSRFAAIVSVTALRDAGNAIIGYLFIGTDNTARSRAEFAQIERTNRELASLNEELRSFSYSVSHDLRGPLRSMDGFSQVLLEDYADKLDADGKDALNRIRAASQRMGALIDDMLRLSQVTRADLKLSQVDLSAIVREISRGLDPQDPARPVLWEIEPGLVARADPALMHIALENLVGNAWKFTGRTSRPVIRFGALQSGGPATYFVSDNGVGFEMIYAGSLFNAFKRLHHTDDFPGTGVGLAIVQRIVRRHGGQARAEGQPGEGATFFFTLEEGLHADDQDHPAR